MWNYVISAKKKKIKFKKDKNNSLALLLSEIIECINFPCKYVRGGGATMVGVLFAIFSSSEGVREEE